MDAELTNAYNGIVQTLVRYGGLDESQARQRLDASGLLDFADDIAREMFFHEQPYYWAMALLYGRTRPRWYDDPALWPPPKGYYDPEWRKTWSS